MSQRAPIPLGRSPQPHDQSTGRYNKASVVGTGMLDSGQSPSHDSFFSVPKNLFKSSKITRGRQGSMQWSFIASNKTWDALLSSSAPSAVFYSPKICWFCSTIPSLYAYFRLHARSSSPAADSIRFRCVCTSRQHSNFTPSCSFLDVSKQVSYFFFIFLFFLLNSTLSLHRDILAPSYCNFIM